MDIIGKNINLTIDGDAVYSGKVVDIKDRYIKLLMDDKEIVVDSFNLVVEIIEDETE